MVVFDEEVEGAQKYQALSKWTAQLQSLCQTVTNRVS